MASRTTYTCDFCGEPLITKNTNPDKTGYCRASDGMTTWWTSDLSENRRGPHVCRACVNALWSVEEKVNHG